jgi:hypothetical protein
LLSSLEFGQPSALWVSIVLAMEFHSSRSKMTLFESIRTERGAASSHSYAGDCTISRANKAADSPIDVAFCY